MLVNRKKKEKLNCEIVKLENKIVIFELSLEWSRDKKLQTKLFAKNPI